VSKTPFMPLWVSDFLGDTLDLDAADIGAYLLILMAQWQRNGASLPDDAAKLQRIARCGRNWAKVWGSVGRFFDTDECGIYNRRLRFEAQNVAAKRDVNSRNGALGAKAKALKNKESDLANANVSLKRNASIPEPEPESKKEKASLSCAKAQRFTEFWTVYPHRDGKRGRKPAEAKYDRIVASGVPEQDLIDGAMRYKSDRRVQNGYSRDPTTWLNQAGWEDEILPGDIAQNGGAKNDRQRFDQTINALADRLSAGTIQLGNSGRDPLAPRRG